MDGRIDHLAPQPKGLALGRQVILETALLLGSALEEAARGSSAS